MNEDNRRLTAKHNILLAVTSIMAVAVITESLLKGWEFWVPPLVIGALVGVWIVHVFQLRNSIMRENYYLIFCMVLAFYHGVHRSGFYDMVAFTAITMAMAAFAKRKEYITLILIEYFVIMAVQLSLENRYSQIDFDASTLIRILLHAICEILCAVVFKKIIADEVTVDEILNGSRAENKKLTDGTDALLAGISDDLLSQENEEKLINRIERIREYSMVRRGEVGLVEEEYRIYDLVEDIISDANNNNKVDRTGFIVDLDPLVPAVLKGDRSKLRVITGQLIDNAFAFTNRGAVCLRVTGVWHDDSYNLIMEISDTGKGMSTELLEDLSRGTIRYGQDDKGTSGIGLGLAIAYGYVRFMNGFVYAESSENKGTKIRVSIAQHVIDPAACMELTDTKFINAVSYLDSKVKRHRKKQELFKNTVDNLAQSLRFNLYYASSAEELKRIIEKSDITDIITCRQEYESDRKLFDDLSKEMTVTVCGLDNEPVYTAKICESLNRPRIGSVKEGGRS